MRCLRRSLLDYLTAVWSVDFDPAVIAEAFRYKDVKLNKVVDALTATIDGALAELGEDVNEASMASKFLRSNNETKAMLRKLLVRSLAIVPKGLLILDACV